jgi:hypothetical protein
MKRLLYSLVCFGSLACGQRILVVDDDAPGRGDFRGDFSASILLREGPSTLREASFDDAFFNGQKFRLEVTANQSGYLYVLCENSQGSTVVLYPGHGSVSGNHVREARRVSIPSRSWFQFDQEPGTEHVYLVLSPRPIPELERSAQRGGELNGEFLDRYANTQATEAKGIYQTERAPEVQVREFELRHEQR